MRVRPGRSPAAAAEPSAEKSLPYQHRRSDALIYTFPGECGTIQQCEVTQVKVAGTDPYQVGTPGGCAIYAAPRIVR
jgi:hypothetical protein